MNLTKIFACLPTPSCPQPRPGHDTELSTDCICEKGKCQWWKFRYKFLLTYLIICKLHEPLLFDLHFC